MEYLKELEYKLDKLIEQLKDELSTIRTNRPTPKLIENIEVEYAGQQVSIKQLGSIGVELPRSLVVNPWSKETTPQIAKAIEGAKLGVTASVQGNIIRVVLPELTEERRQELSKITKNIAEKIKIHMRTLRDEVNKKINNEPDEDQKFRNKEKLQNMVDSFNKGIDSLVENKLNELSN
jgi:ribosome recycling factor